MAVSVVPRVRDGWAMNNVENELSVKPTADANIALVFAKRVLLPVVEVKAGV